MRFLGKAWKLLVGIKDAMVLLLLILFFGGLYGVSLGKAFFGESMFHVQTDASKVALASLVEKLRNWDFHFIDSQMTTEHMLRFGAKELPRRVFLKRLQSALGHPTKRGRWRIET